MNERKTRIRTTTTITTSMRADRSGYDGPLANIKIDLRLRKRKPETVCTECVSM